MNPKAGIKPMKRPVSLASKNHFLIDTFSQNFYGHNQIFIYSFQKETLSELIYSFETLEIEVKKQQKHFMRVEMACFQ